MKTSWMIAVVALVLSSTGRAQEIKSGETLSPQDLGIDKRVLTAAPTINQVVRISSRLEEDKLSTWSTHIVFSPDKPVEQSILIFDRGIFDESQRDSWVMGRFFAKGLRFDGSEQLRENKCTYFFKPTVGDLDFKIVYWVTIEVLEYKDAKKLYPILPPNRKGTSWTHTPEGGGGSAPRKLEKPKSEALGVADVPKPNPSNKTLIRIASQSE